MTNLLKRNFLLGIVALCVALPAVPAFADRDDAREGHRGDPQSERREAQERHEREARERREHRDDRFAYRGPYGEEHCFTRDGYWTSDGWQRVWVPPQRICR